MPFHKLQFESDACSCTKATARVVQLHKLKCSYIHYALAATAVTRSPLNNADKVCGSRIGGHTGNWGFSST